MGTPVATTELVDLEPDVVRTVHRWLDVAAAIPRDKPAGRLAAMLGDDDGLAFTVGFVDGVIRPEDPRVAARTLARLARDVPRFLPLHLRAAVRLAAVAGLVAPGLVVPVVRAALRHMVGHLVVDARPRPFGRAVRRLRAGGASLNVNLLGEAVLGAREAARRLANTERLLARDDVDYVSIKVSSAVAPHSEWAFDAAVQHVAESLTPLFRVAAGSSPRKFVNLDMEEYRDLELTVAVFTRLLDRPEFRGLSAGIVLQAYLPDSLAVLQRLQTWAASRVAGGGAPIKVRVVKGANLPMEHVDATLHGWPLATWSTKQQTDTNYKRLLDYAFRPEHTAHVRIGVAGHNLFDVAFAWLLAQRRGVVDGVDFEMLLGMAAGQAEAVRRDVGGLLLYTPVVHPREFDVAIAYLVRRLEEGASHDNFMSAVFDLHDDPRLFDREHERFAASLAALDDRTPEPHRTQPRAAPAEVFANTPDTDPAVRANEVRGREILDRVAGSRRGVDQVTAATVTSASVLDERIGAAVASSWGTRTGTERAAVLRSAAAELERRRGELIEVMAAEAGKTVDQADPEVSEAVDFANYYATLAVELDTIDGARHRPAGLAVVTPPWNFPVAIPTGSTLAPLAAGSAVIVKPAPQAERCAAVMVEALHAAGVPRDAVQLLIVDETELGRDLIADPRVDRVVLTGGYETAELFRTFRTDLPLLAETSGKNAIVITPSADLDLAVKDVVASAFGHAGQKCSAASLVILVGSVATSRRFRDQLVDAVRSLQVGWPQDARTRMGPLVEPAGGKLLHALTTLEPGEEWLVRPEQRDDAGRLWTPGVKIRVAPGSPFHLTEYFGPVLGIMTAPDLDAAIELQNAPAYGLTAGLHSLDEAEIGRWLGRIEAGNLYVNRGITGAIVRRQPFGGWKRSAVGAGTKAGGPNHLMGLSDWEPAAARHGVELDARQQLLLDACPDDRLGRALASDALAWRDHFAASDVSQLGVERNVLRYLPHPVLVRHDIGSVVDLVRVVGAGVRAGSAVHVSAAAGLPEPIAEVFTRLGVTVTVDDPAAWRARLAQLPSGRVRLISGSAAEVYAAVDGRPDIAVYDHPVTESGRIELLPFVREQAVSVTAHRFGTPTHLSDRALPLGERRRQWIRPR